MSELQQTQANTQPILEDKMMGDQEHEGWAVDKVEYESSLAQHRHFAGLRRQDMMFVTAVQAAILTSVKESLFRLTFATFPLTLTAFLVLLLGPNSERRLSAYMQGYMERAREIEERYGLSFLHAGTRHVSSQRYLLHNYTAFPLYYMAFILAWILIWVANIAR